jgi:hypothetical protein
MQERSKAQITIGLLAFFASVWVLYEYAKGFPTIIESVGIIIVLLIVMLILSYILIAILEWINLFNLKTNSILTLIVLTAFMINLTIFLFSNQT